ncbi:MULTISPECIES: hypothetical protein [Streptomyces]|uniref:hypothetical protein n=1 Tax=Streptomyces TaxID=1883 RepID=UPI0027BB1F86|nr:MULTISPECIES: hypothetical protein [unclassified Streptomyces]
MRLDDRLPTVVGLSGTTVRLLDEAGSASMVLLSHLLTSEDFELIGQNANQGRMPPFALLDIVPEREAEKAAAWPGNGADAVEVGVLPAHRGDE